MKATQLDQMKEDYSYIMKTKTMTQNTVEKHREASAKIITLSYLLFYILGGAALETMCDLDC